MFQYAVIECDDGRMVTIEIGKPTVVSTDPLVNATLTEDLLVVRNTGAPDRFRATEAQPRPFYFRSLMFFPDPSELRIPQSHPVDGSRPVGDSAGPWVLVGSADFKHAHHEALDPAQPWYARSRFAHMLDGGDAFVVRLVRPDRQFETDKASGVEERARRETAAAIGNYSQTLLNAYPLAKANLALYNFTPSSINGMGVANFGRMLLADHFVKKYTSWPRELVSGWYGAPDHQLPGEGQCNVHYGHAGHWLASYLYGGDPMARTIGLWLVRAKCALGLVDSDVSYVANWTVGSWRGEKAGRGRRGSALGPDSAKEWDFDLLMALCLEPDDSVFLRALEVRRRRLATVPFATIWNGAGGGRRAGNFLRNLLDHYWFALSRGEANVAYLMLRRAITFAAHVFRVHRAAAAAWFAKYGKPMRWFHNLYVPGRMKAWEEATLYVALAELSDVEPFSEDDEAMLTDMMHWLTVNGTRTGAVYDETGKLVAAGDFVQVAYEVGVDPTAPPYFYASTPSNSLWHVPLVPHLARRRVDAPSYYRRGPDGTVRLVDEAFRFLGRTWETIGQGEIPPHQFAVQNPGEGPAAHKSRAYAMLALRGA